MELGYLTDGVTPACTYSEDPGCMQKREDYIGCPLAGTGACPGKWYTLSPYTAYPADGPPVFLANATHELVALVEAVDMQHRLAELGVPRQFCKVKGSSHATGYEDLPCAGDATTTVFEATLTFIGAHLPNPEGGVVELGSRGAWIG
jgi:acetyl esterase/lipase